MYTCGVYSKAYCVVVYNIEMCLYKAFLVQSGDPSNICVMGRSFLLPNGNNRSSSCSCSSVIESCAMLQ